jgi:REP element-mobilizing transposase RayT
MFAYLATIFKEYDSPALLVGGTADHVHILCNLTKTNTLAKVIGEAKRNSSKWIKTKNEKYSSFQWQNGYGAFSVSYSNIMQVQNYISNQDNHHHNLSFQEEFRELLRKHNVKFDEKYVWD